MVTNVGKELRRCGIHTTLAKDRDEVRNYASKHKKCQIITMGKALNELNMTQGFAGRVHGVPFNGNQSLDQQVEYVLRKLKIKVYEEDYCTRCLNQVFLIVFITQIYEYLKNYFMLIV